MRRWSWLAPLLAGLAVSAGWAQVPQDAPLAPCPASPNCVNSEADPADRVHFVAPLPLPPGLDPVDALDAFEAVVRAAPRTEVVERSPLRLRATDRSRLFRFVDDVDARIDVATRVLHVRSAARVGRGDLGVNRRRVEAYLSEVARLWGVAWPSAR